ncbi:MAG: 4Fe-4S dicluster protein [Phycisphaerales bacterium]|nr:4Fe-4S dicluster protein [Phycisphaerales bacterium]
MPYVIAEPCVGVKDTACVVVCPVDCIHPTSDKADFAAVDQLFIDRDPCIDCGLCVDECPVSAIFSEEDLPAEWQDYIEKTPPTSGSRVEPAACILAKQRPWCTTVEKCTKTLNLCFGVCH